MEKLSKNCLYCRNIFYKPQNQSLKDWNNRHKYCCKECYSLSQKGKPSKLKGTKLSKQHIEKLRLSHIGIFKGEKSPSWIEDRSKLKKYNVRNDPAYQEWSRSVKNRDGWKCKICKGKDRLVSHHIKSFTFFPEEAYNINNGITLCHEHHPRKRVDEQRLIPYFQSLVGSREQ